MKVLACVITLCFLLYGVLSQRTGLGLGEQCTVTGNCSSVQYSACINNVCSCENGTVQVTGRCLKAADHIGEACEDDAQCRLQLGSMTYCDQSHKCACNERSVGFNTRCLPIKNLTEDCTAQIQCSHIPNALCKENICSCVEDFILDGNTCLPKVSQFKGACKLIPQCSTGNLGPGGTCRNDVCICETEYYFSGTTCLYKHGLDENCEGSDQGCYLEDDGEKQHVECRNKICKCMTNFKPSKDNKKCEPSGAQQVVVSLSLLAAILAVSVAV